MKKAFTLIELVMVIVIIGILAVIAIPKFVDIRNKATSASEDAIIASLRSAMSMKHAVNLVNGSDIWPGYAGDLFTNGPFEVLSNPPPNNLGIGNNNGDGVTWGYQNVLGQGYYQLCCPHYNGTVGRMWIYNYWSVSNPVPFGPGNAMLPGEIRIEPRFTTDPS